MLLGIFEEIPKWFFARIFRLCPSRRRNAEMAEWLMAADCKSAGLTPYGGSNPSLGTINKTSCVVHQAGIAQLVERQPSKLNVAGSNPVSRSIPPEKKEERPS